MRRKIAEHMVLTKRSCRARLHGAPDRLHGDRERAARAVKDRFLEQNGVKLTFLPFFIARGRGGAQGVPDR